MEVANKILMVVVLVFMFSVSVSAVDVSSCSTLGSAGTPESHTQYTQTANIDAGGGSCLTMNAANVDFNGNGYNITNCGSATGEQYCILPSKANITISNFRIIASTPNSTAIICIFGAAGSDPGLIIQNGECWDTCIGVAHSDDNSVIYNFTHWIRTQVYGTSPTYGRTGLRGYGNNFNLTKFNATCADCSLAWGGVGDSSAVTAGILYYIGNPATVTDFYISGFNYGFLITSNNNQNHYNGIITGVVNASFRRQAYSGIATFVNVSFVAGSQGVASIAGGTVKTEQDYSALVTSGGSPVASVTVNASNVSGTILWSATTGADGRIPVQNITDAWYTTGGMSSWSNITITAYKTGYNTFTKSINISAIHTRTYDDSIVLTEVVSSSSSSSSSTSSSEASSSSESSLATSSSQSSSSSSTSTASYQSSSSVSSSSSTSSASYQTSSSSSSSTSSVSYQTSSSSSSSSSTSTASYQTSSSSSSSTSSVSYQTSSSSSSSTSSVSYQTSSSSSSSSSTSTASYQTSSSSSSSTSSVSYQTSSSSSSSSSTSTASYQTSSSSSSSTSSASYQTSSSSSSSSSTSTASYQTSSSSSSSTSSASYQTSSSSSSSTSSASYQTSSSSSSSSSTSTACYQTSSSESSSDRKSVV